jgi:hypothetical protein
VADEVRLSWTMPARNTDRLALRGEYTARLCRQPAGSSCVEIATLRLRPGAPGSFSDALPPSLAEGPLRPLAYFAEVVNGGAHSAGLSAPAETLAGEQPGSVEGFQAAPGAAGVMLSWQPLPGRELRLTRRLLGTAPDRAPAPGARQAGPGGQAAGLAGALSLPAAGREAEELTLHVALPEAAGGRALDATALPDRRYAYTASYVVHQPGGGPAAIAGPATAPVEVDTRDVFAPAAPAGLASVRTGEPPAVDLSWQPGSEPDLAGYFVYRAQDGGPMERISGERPLPGPAFHDAEVAAGHRYRYAVSAVDTHGNESERSRPAEEDVP